MRDVNNGLQSRSGRARISLIPICAVLYASLLPSEVRLQIGTAELFAYRIAIITALAWAILEFRRNPFRINTIDWLLALNCSWIVISLVVNLGIQGFEAGISNALDLGGAYFIARVSLRSADDVRRVLVLFLPGLAIAGASLALESLTHTRIVRPLAAGLFGKLGSYASAGANPDFMEIRLGLYRAYGPFPHPILAGLYLSSVFCIAQFAHLPPKTRFLGIVAAFFAIFGVSSSAFIGLGLSIALVLYDFLQRRFEFLSWKKLFIGLAVPAITLQLFAGGGIVGFIIRYLTLNPQTGMYRLLIWRYGSASVVNNPVFGIGYSDFIRASWMVGSVDTQWLLMAMRYGVLGAIPLFVATVTVIVKLAGNAEKTNGRERDMLVGFAMSLAVFVLITFTVSLYGSLISWFAILLAMSTSLAYPQRISSRRRPSQPIGRHVRSAPITSGVTALPVSSGTERLT